MKKLNLSTILVLLLSLSVYGQNDMTAYRALVGQADSLYAAKDFQKSAIAYQEAFDGIGGKAIPGDRYNAACSYALAGDSENAFFHLFYSAEKKYKNYNHITVDADLNSLHTDERWDKLLAIVQANKDEAEKDLDKPLVALLDGIYKEDQSYRMQIDGIEEKFGRNSEEMKQHWTLINEKDSINVIKVQEILDERGWLGADVVGSQGNSTLFLVIQHADIEVQDKYLPMMREAVKKGNARASSLALLEDRVALRKGKKQIYGSQVGRDQDTGEHYVLPLVDPENVDKRREQVGLGPIADYIGHWNMTWDVQKHIDRTKKNESKEH